MKTNIHPTWYPEAKVVCACGNTFSVGSTAPQLNVEICANCHPFYTGKMKFIDTAGRVDSFKNRQAKASKKLVSKTEKRRIKKQRQIEKELERPDNLEELRKKIAK